MAPAGALGALTREPAGTFGSAGSGSGQLSDPQNVAIDQTSGDLYVADTGNNRVDEFDASGNFIRAFGADVGGSGVDTCTTACQAGTSGSSAGQFTSAQFVAVDNSTGASAGDVYVGDPGDGLVSKFGSDGTLITAWGAGGQLAGSSSATFGPLAGVTVDSSGDLIVVDQNSTESVFAQDGTFSSSAALVRGTNPDGTGVDPTGNLFKANEDSSVEKLTSAATDVGQVTLTSAAAIASDPGTGDLYVATSGATLDHYAFDGSGNVLEPGGSTCTPAPYAGCAASDSVSLPFTPGAVALNTASGDTYVSNSSAGQVAIFGPLVAVPDVSTGQATNNTTGTSATLTGNVDPAGAGDITDCHFDYGSDTTYGQSVPCSQATPITSAGAVTADISGLQQNTTYHFRLVAANANGPEDGADQTFTTPAPPAFGGPDEGGDAGFNGATKTTASLFANINPDGLDTTYHVEYGPDTTYGSVAPIPDADLGSAPGLQNVTFQLTGLAAGTTYHYRFVAVNSLGTATGDDHVFATLPAFYLLHAGAAQVGATTAQLSALVNPNGDDTTYHFEWGSTSAYGNTVPVGDADLGAGTDPVTGTVHLTALTPSTTYHFRFVGTNALGTIDSPDHTFTTWPATSSPGPDTCPNAQFRTGPAPAGGLPDCRAYELVSPVDKNGGDVSPDTSRTRAAAGLALGEPMAVQYTSRNGFGDVQGGGKSVDYMAIRDAAAGTQGWATHAISPETDPMGLHTAAGGDSFYEGDLSPDLSAGIYLASSPLTAQDPMVANVENLYVRNDLRTAGKGTYNLVSGCPGCTSPLQPPFFNSDQYYQWLDGTSADFSHVLFESRYGLASDTPQCDRYPAQTCPTRLYEWVNGTVSPVGVLPDGTVAAESVAGQGQEDLHAASPNTVSQDGRKAFFTAYPTSCGGQPCPSLYMRLDGTSTVQLNASERTDCADHNPCSGTPEPDPGGPKPATYWGATPDGSRVFFTTGEALTDDAPLGGGYLYMYDTAKPASDPHNLTLLNPAPTGDLPDAQGVIGYSNDGSWVYFFDNTQLVSGAPAIPGGFGIFAWHDGNVQYLGQMARYLDSRGVGDIFPFDLTTAGGGQTIRDSRVTPDGQHLLMALPSDPVLGDTGYDQGCADPHTGGACLEFYLFSTRTGRWQCVSCDPSGAAASATARINVGDRNEDGTGPAGHASHLSDALTADGSKVFFSSPDPLVPQDVNGTWDAYEFDSTTGKISLLSTGTDPNPSYFMDASPDGNDVFIYTAQRLVGWDKDTAYDLYDVRVDGGFAGPPAPPPPCQDDACQGTLSGGPTLPSAGTVSFYGPGNAQPGSTKRGQRPRVLTRTVRGPSFEITVRVPGAGRIRVTGGSIREAGRTVRRAGAYRLRVTLTARERRLLRHRHRLRLRARVAFIPVGGAESSVSFVLNVRS